MRMALALAGVLAALALTAPGGGVHAQQLGVVQSDIVVIDPERLLTETEFGRRLQAEIQADRDRLIAYNERVASELEAEEKSLTGLRADTPPDEFRALADAFDQRVEQLRLDSERMSRELERRRDLAPIQFMRIVQPVLAELLRESDAVVMLDARSVLLHAEVADVSDLAISRIDAAVGRGPDVIAPPLSIPNEDAPAEPQQ